MAQRTSVVDLSGNYEESLQRWARDLGTDSIRRQIFKIIYGRGSKPRSKKQLMGEAGIKPRAAQQVQNQLEHLYGKHLIGRVDNDGSVRDGSHYLYTKDEHVRPHKDQIIRVADNRRLGDGLATKRNPIVRGNSVVRVVVTRQALKKRKRLDVLYLTANPNKKNALRLDVELRQVQDAIRGSKLRDNIALTPSPPRTSTR